MLLVPDCIAHWTYSYLMNTSQNNYVASLKLDFDPFEAKATSKDFFAGGGRQDLLDDLLPLLRTSGVLLAVTGELGIGKTTLAHELVRQLGKETVCARVQATLFMNRQQFLEQMMSELGLPVADGEQDPLDVLTAFANELALDARTLVLVIDDAQELASDVHEVIAKLMRRNSGGGFSVIMLGEPQLQGLFQRGLPAALNQQIQYREFPVFDRQDSEEYARYKLARAGYRKSLPLTGGEMGRVYNASAGHPGKLNAQLILTLNETSKAETRTVPRGEEESLAQLGKSYWLAAASLVLVLLLVVFWPVGELDPAAQRGQSIPVSVSQTDRSVAVPASAAQREPEAVVEPVRENVATAAASDATPARQEPVADALPQNAQPEEAPVQAPDRGISAADADLTVFEQSLLNAPPGSYTVQILGSRSAESIRQFLAEHSELTAGGYFETRYQGQPWYVLVAGSYSQRQNAELAISRMPADVRQLQPWVRSLADIQANLRDLHTLP